MGAVKIQVGGGGLVAKVTLSRPERMNAFDREMLRELGDLVRGVGDSEKLRVLVVTGEGKAFSAGADLQAAKASAMAVLDQRMRRRRPSRGGRKLRYRLGKSEAPSLGKSACIRSASRRGRNSQKRRPRRSRKLAPSACSRARLAKTIRPWGSTTSRSDPTVSRIARMKSRSSGSRSAAWWP